MASEGPKNCSTAADNTSIGTVAWANPTNAQGSSDATVAGFAASGPTAGNTVSHYLKFTNFGFSAVTGTVNGVQADVRWRKDTTLGATAGTDTSVKLVVGGSVVGTSQHTGASAPASLTTKGYGSTSSTWGATVAASDVTASTFGFAFSGTVAALAKGTVGGINVAWVDMTVTYTAGGKLFRQSSLCGLGAGGPFFADPLCALTRLRRLWVRTRSPRARRPYWQALPWGAA